MKIRIWGARGSLPAPHSPEMLEGRISEVLEGFFAAGHRTKEEIRAYVERLPPQLAGGFGGNTPCVEVRSASGSTQVIVDGGSGIRALGAELMKGPCGRGEGEVRLFLTHFHWDHLIGLPFFTPLFVPGNTVHVHAVQPQLEEVFRTVFRKPYFPLELDQLGARVVYHRLEPRRAFQVGELKVTPYALDHPDPCWGFRFESGGKVYSHCVDTEARRVSREELGPDLPLYQGVDLMVFDAQYTLMETIEKVNWGHATASIGLDIAMREGVKRVVFVHHDPAASDEKIVAAEAQARRYYQAQLKRAAGCAGPGGARFEVDWVFGREGMTFEA